MEFDEGVTGPTDRKKRNRTIKNRSESKAICPVMNPLTKSYADDEPELEVSVKESLNSCEVIYDFSRQGTLLLLLIKIY